MPSADQAAAQISRYGVEIADHAPDLLADVIRPAAVLQFPPNCLPFGYARLGIALVFEDGAAIEKLALALRRGAERQPDLILDALGRDVVIEDVLYRRKALRGDEKSCLSAYVVHVEATDEVILIAQGRCFSLGGQQKEPRVLDGTTA